MEGTPPAIWAHLTKAYDAMEEKATDGVYEGFVTKLLTIELSIPVPYYGKVLRLLAAMGCIEQLQRGGGTSPSRWKLHKKPVIEDFNKVVETSPGAALSSSRQQIDGAIDNRVRVLEQRLEGVDVKQALFDLQKQINELKGIKPPKLEAVNDNP